MEPYGLISRLVPEKYGGDGLCFVTAAVMVDRCGNVNTTCIGSYVSPQVRLTGSGAAD